MGATHKEFWRGLLGACIKRLAAGLIAIVMLGAPQAMGRSEAPEGPLTREELRQRTIQRLHEIEAVGDALRDHSSSHEVCRARGFLVGSEGFARCWIAVEETVLIRAKAIAKADALAAVVRALLSKHTNWLKFKIYSGFTLFIIIDILLLWFLLNIRAEKDLIHFAGSDDNYAITLLPFVFLLQ